MLNALGIAWIGDVTPDGYRQVEVDPRDLYPQTIAHIRSRLQTNSAPDGALRQEWDQALLLPLDAWDWALLPKEQINADAHEARAAALEIARRWFTEVLHGGIGGPMHLRITKDAAYKL